MNLTKLSTLALAAALLAGGATAQSATPQTTMQDGTPSASSKDQQNALKKQENASKQEAKSDKAQRKALRQEQKAKKAAARTSPVAN